MAMKTVQTLQQTRVPDLYPRSQKVGRPQRKEKGGKERTENRFGLGIDTNQAACAARKSGPSPWPTGILLTNREGIGSPYSSGGVEGEPVSAPKNPVMRKSQMVVREREREREVGVQRQGFLTSSQHRSQLPVPDCSPVLSCSRWLTNYW